MAATARLRFRPGPLRSLLHDQRGPVGTYISRKGNNVARRARLLAHEHTRSGKLERGIRAIYRGDLKEPAIDVGIYGVPYAMAFLLGHRAFRLPYKLAGVYAFEVGHEQVFTKGPINIPRTEGHNILEHAAIEEGLRLRIRRDFR